MGFALVHAIALEVVQASLHLETNEAKMIIFPGEIGRFSRFIE